MQAHFRGRDFYFFAGGDMEFSETLGFDAHTHTARILCGLYSQQGVDLGPNTSWKSNPGNLISFFYGLGPWQFQQSDWS